MSPTVIHPLAHRLAAGAPDWARRPLRAWDRDELARREPFITVTDWQAATDVELPELAGTADPDYAGLSCVELLDCGTHRLSGVEIRRHRYDRAAATAFAELADALAQRRLPLHALVSRRLIAREDGPGWSRETFTPLVTLFHPGGSRELLTPQQAADRAAALRRDTWLQRCAVRSRHALPHRAGRPRHEPRHPTLPTTLEPSDA